MDSIDLDLDLDSYLLHPQPQHSLRIVHAFIGFNHRAIEHVWEEKVPTQDGVLRQEQLIWCIKRQQQERALSHTHFKLRAMFLYSMDLEAEDIRELHQPHYPSHEFITPISAVEDVIVQPTIPMFASLNALYIMYEASTPRSHAHNQHNTHNQSKKRIVINHNASQLQAHKHKHNKHKHTRRT